MSRTPNAEAFLKANAESPVVSGAVRYRPRSTPAPCNVIGGRYKLADGRAFNLTTEECRSLPMPRWFGVDA